MSKVIEQATNWIAEDKVKLNILANHVSRLQKYAVKHPDDTEFAKVYQDYQQILLKAHECFTDIICGEFDDMLVEFNGQVSDIWADEGSDE
jgi:selenophosphate synthase